MYKAATCCPEGADCVAWTEIGTTWFIDTDEYRNPLTFCPFCGQKLKHDASPHEFATVKPSLRICFDVDGVIAKEEGEYMSREAFPHAVAMMKRYKEAGHTIIIHTARYMKRCDKDIFKAYDEGFQELVRWLKRHDVPYDEVYMGKPSADIYVDDKACRVQSANSTHDWQVNLEAEIRQAILRKEMEATSPGAFTKHLIPMIQLINKKHPLKVSE